MTSFSPERGPQSGETEVTIDGSNLDVGSRISVTVAGNTPCNIIRFVSVLTIRYFGTKDTN